MDVTARFPDLLLVALQIEIQMRESVILDVTRGIAHRLEFRQAIGCGAALLDEALLDVSQGALQLRVGKRLLGICLELR